MTPGTRLTPGTRYLNPDALDLTDAELAEIVAATRLAVLAAGRAGAAGDPDPAGVADALAAQASAVSARRRGPAQPGSARLLAGESSSRAAAFATGMPLDVMPACPDLALLADAAAGPDDSYAGASDDELVGVLCAWDRLGSHMTARMLAAVAELSRRRPLVETPPSGRPAGSAAEDFTADELAHVLAESGRKAGGLLTVADQLDGKLPGTRALLRDGVITLVKAQIIAAATAPLDEDEAAAAEGKVLGRAGRITPGSLRAAIRQAVMDVAPEKAKKRREQAAKTAQVEQWGEDSGNGALAGRELPPAEVLAAGQRITWWARQLRGAGLDGDMDQLRARALIDLLLARDSRPGQHDASPIPAGLAPASRDGPPGSYGTWTLHTPDPGPDLIIEPDPITTDNCDHRFQVQGHDPGAKLRHLAQVRHATCVSPVCRRPAATSDFEHNIPYEAGGRTCLCNTGPQCKS